MPNLPYRPPPVVAQKTPARPSLAQGRRPRRPRRIARLARPVPWLLISALVHLAVLLLVTLNVHRPLARAHFGPIQVGLYTKEPEPPPRLDPPHPKPQPPKPEPDPTEAPPADPGPLAPAPPGPEPDPETQTPTVQAPPVLEVLPGPRPARDLFAARSAAGRRRALRQWGGTPASEDAVDAGLDWLHRHQEAPTGRWADGDPQFRLAPSLTALALLAFLGKGHTHLGDGPYRQTIARAVDYLLGIQSQEGRFGPPFDAESNRYLMYHQAIATFALSEAYALTLDSKLVTPLQRAIAFIERAQQPGGGWDYGPATTGRNDLSVTGWQLMALKSARAAGLSVRWQTLFDAMRALTSLTNSPSGEVAYADRGTYAWRRGPGMIAVAMLCYQILGWPRDGELLRRQGALLLDKHLPDWKAMAGQNTDDRLNTMYYWYYGTLAMFNLGGHAWETWNSRLRDLLVARQQRRGDKRGSWDPPPSGFDSVGGRVYATALNVLSLQVYYRYLPFHTTRGFNALDILARATKVHGRLMQRQALQMLGHFRDPRAEAILAHALDEPDPATRAVARQALVKLRSEKVIPALVQDLQAEQASTRVRAISLLDHLAFPRLAPVLIQALRDPERVVRHRAVLALRRLTGQSFAFQPEAVREDREGAVRRWEQWWKADDVAPPPGGIRGTVLVVDPQTPDAVVLDVGRKHAVRPGVQFEVLRGGQPIALLEAERVKPTLTLARVIRRGLRTIQANDKVRSRAAPQPSSPPKGPGNQARASDDPD